MTSQTTGSLDDFARTSQLMVPRGSRPPGGARALLGWLAPEHAKTLLASQADGELSDAQRARVSQALAAVAERPAGVDQDGLISPLPDELADHVTRLEATAAGARMRADGWEIAMVDLARVVAIAPSVFTGKPTPTAAPATSSTSSAQTCPDTTQPAAGNNSGPYGPCRPQPDAQ